MDIIRAEREGIDGTAVAAGIAVVMGLLCVKAYISAVATSQKQRTSVYRFLLLALYSMHARVSFAHRDLYLSESTLAIGVGNVGLARVDDVHPFSHCMLLFA